jgi:Chaperone of endosialidase
VSDATPLAIHNQKPFSVDKLGGILRNSLRMKTNFGSLAILALAFSFLPTTQAVAPPPDGGYPGGNTAEGQDALFSLTIGTFNTAIGFSALHSNDLGNLNTAIGAGALFATADSVMNTAVGAGALLLNTGGTGNTATGAFALINNRSGTGNTAIGNQALQNNVDASGNTAVGSLAMLANTDGSTNTALGDNVLRSNTTGGHNTAVGESSLFSTTASDGNTAVGEFALFLLDGGSNNIALGTDAGQMLQTGDGNLYIGADIPGQMSESNHTYISNINTTSVSGAGTDTVTVDLMTGLLGHLSSSRRYKEEIKSMDSASETLYRLKPVTFRYKKEINPSQTLEYGLVAEDVAEADPNLAIRNKNGEIESVRYTAVNAMLLNEFLKEHRRVEGLKSAMAQQRKDFETAISQQQETTKALVARVNEQEARIQSVSARIEAHESETKILVNNR